MIALPQTLWRYAAVSLLIVLVSVSMWVQELRMERADLAHALNRAEREARVAQEIASQHQRALAALEAHNDRLTRQLAHYDQVRREIEEQTDESSAPDWLRALPDRLRTQPAD